MTVEGRRSRLRLRWRARVREMMPGAARRSRATRGRPVDLRARLPRVDEAADLRGVRAGRRAVPRRGRRDARLARAAEHRADRDRRDPGPAGRPDRAPVLALRRGAGRRGGEVGVAAVRGDRAGRGDVRPRCRRLEVEHPDARRRAARVGRQAAGRHQDRDRGPGGDRERVHDLPADEAPALRRRRDGDRRHGQRPSRRADADGRAPRHGRRDRRGAHARRARSTAASSVERPPMR